MKNKVFSVLVILALLVSAVPTAFVQAAQPKDYAPVEFTVCPPGMYGYTLGAVVVPSDPSAPTDADVMFVFDTTGSMGGVLDSAKAGAIDIMNTVKATFPAATFGVVEYKDYGDGLPYALRQALTADNTAVSNAIAPLTAGGGGDFPESAGAALSPSYDAGNPWGWKGGTTGKYVVLFTDATAVEADIDARLTAMGAANVTLLVVASGSYDYWLVKAAMTGPKGTAVAYDPSTFVTSVTSLILTAASRSLTLNVTGGYDSWVSAVPSSYNVPAAGGTYSFDITVNVPGGTTGDHTFEIQTMVDGVLLDLQMVTVHAACNSAPVADNDAYNTPMSTLLNATTVLDGDTDADMDPLTAILVTAPSNASSFTFNPDGTFSYTPVNGFSGDDTFTYKANDGTSDSNVATVTITVANSAPTSLTLSNRFIQEERPAGVVVGALSSTDPDLGDTATYSLVDTVACPGTDNGYFAVNGTNLVTSGTPRIDFQTKYYLAICLRVTDTAGLTFDQPYTIVVRSIHQFPMDVDGDGKDDYITFRPIAGTWHLRNTPPNIAFGQLGDLPVGADFNGDGKDDIAVFRPAATGQWLVRGQNPINFGTAGDVPLPLDFNGDKKADFAVFRPSTATWHIRGQLLTLSFGQTGDIPVPADYNGDGKADIAVFRPSNGTWYIQNQPAIAFGVDGDIPVPFDYNKDGKADIAVYRPSTGTWHIRNMTVVTFGGMYDLPFPMHLQSATSVNFVVIHTGPTQIQWLAQGLPTINFGANDDVQQ